MKKILCIIGNRNKNSRNYSVITQIKEKLDLQEFTILTPSEYKLNACRGCKSCFMEGVCPLDKQDEGGDIKTKIIESDLLVISSPIYAHNVSGDFKILIDRLSFWLHDFHLLGKPVIIINTTDSNGNREVEEYLQKIFELLGCTVLFNESFLNTFSSQKNEYIYHKILTVINKFLEGDFQPIITKRQEAFYQDLKFIMSLLEEDSYEYRRWRENKLFECESLQELLEKRIKGD